MAINLEHFIGILPDGLKERVEQARSQHLKIIQGELRKESGMMLNRSSSVGLLNNPDQVSIPIKIIDGIPEYLRSIQFDAALMQLVPLMPYRSLLVQMANSGSNLSGITNTIESLLNEDLERCTPRKFY